VEKFEVKLGQLACGLMIGAVVVACTPKALQIESLQNAFQEKAAAECEYETRNEPSAYHLCMKAKGAEK
jgi:hypothetical protein